MKTNTEMQKHISRNSYSPDVRYFGSEQYFNFLGILRTLFKFEKDPMVIMSLREKKKQVNSAEVWVKFKEDRWELLNGRQVQNFRPNAST